MTKYIAPLDIRFDDGISLEEFRTKTNAALDTLNSQWAKLLESLDANRLASIESELAKLDQLANQVAALETVDPAIASAMQDSITSLEAKVSQLETDIQEAQNMIAVIAGTPVSPPQPSEIHDPATYVALLEDWDPTKLSNGTTSWTRTNGIRDHNSTARQLNEVQSGSLTGMVNQTLDIYNEQLRIQIGAEDAGDGTGSSYHQFYTKDPGYTFPPGFIQSWILNGTWSADINTLRFRVMVDKEVLNWAVNGQNNMGTYVKDKADADGGNQGGHWYHKFDNNYYANKWIICEMNSQPQTQVGTSGSSVWPFNPTSPVNYFDGMTRFYLTSNSISKPAAVGMTITYDDFRYLIKDNLPIYGRPGAGDGPSGTVQVCYVSNVTVQHNGTAYELTWAGPKGSSITYDIYRSTGTSMLINGLGVGTLLATGGASTPGNDYTNCLYTSGTLTDENCYFAIKPQGYDNFYEIWYENFNA